jgi:hypothetical protein
LISFKSIYKAAIPLNSEIIKPLISGSSVRFFDMWKSSNCSIRAPEIAGIDIINENSADFLAEIPSRRAIQIVRPLLDIPGMMAIP